MDIEQIKNLVDEVYENRPTKDVLEKCLLDIINENNKITNKDNTKLIEDMDKLIESIKIYLSVTSK
jgi:hypothetical protein